MKYRNLIRKTFLSLTVIGALGSATLSQGQAEPLRVALALPGSISDRGFNASAHAGLMLIKERMGDDVEVTFSEDVQRPDFVSTLRDYAARGYDVIFTHGFQWSDAIQQVARENPDISFMNVYGVGSADNLLNLDVSNEDLFYVLGYAATRMSESGTVGAVGGWEIPPIRIQVDAFMRGVAAGDPDVDFRSIFTGTFYDAVRGREATKALIDQGADVIAHMADATGLGVIQSASEADVLSIGYFVDQREVAPNSVATSAIINVPEMYWAGIQSVMDGSFEGGQVVYGLGTPVLAVGPWGDMVSAEVQNETAALVQDIVDGNVVVERANVGVLMEAEINMLE
ncbi:MAG: BMP family protein [Rhodobacter sp.]|nr:BMP family protein [Rhodobacter sp.]